MNKHDATIYLKGIKDFHGLDKASEEAIIHEVVGDV